MAAATVELRLARAGWLIATGLVAQLGFSWLAHPLAFVGFLLIACPLVVAGILVFFRTLLRVDSRP
jgi:hypothetical protein